jgi:hypothetical protein
MNRLLDSIDRLTPKDPRMQRVVDLLLPILLTALLIIAIIQIGEVSNAASEAKRTADQTKVLARQNRHFAKELSSGLIRSCQQNGNPLRRAVQQLLRQQIRAADSTPPSFFPSIPPDRFRELIRRGDAFKRRAIHKVEPVRCAEQYPGPKPAPSN